VNIYRHQIIYRHHHHHHHTADRTMDFSLGLNALIYTVSQKLHQITFLQLCQTSFNS